MVKMIIIIKKFSFFPALILKSITKKIKNLLLYGAMEELEENLCMLTI